VCRPRSKLCSCSSKGERITRDADGVDVADGGADGADGADSAEL
jgi:hypothetical protein